MIFDSANEITEKIYNTWKKLSLPENSVWKINFNSSLRFFGRRSSMDSIVVIDKMNPAGRGAGVKLNFPWTIHQFFSNYAYMVKGDIQSLHYHKMTKICLDPLTTGLHLFDFCNLPSRPANIHNYINPPPPSLTKTATCVIL